MDERTLALLQADITSQVALIDTIFARLQERAHDLQPNNEAQLESVAFQLHNLYGAVEELCKIVAGHFENQVTDVSRWHLELLRRMAQPIPGVRPALLSQDSFLLLNGLRSFRHFFRHAYASPIEFAHLQINIGKAQQVYPYLKRDIDGFLREIGDRA